MALPRRRPRAAPTSGAAALLLMLIVLSNLLLAPPLGAGSEANSSAPSFLTFESGPVRPLALTPDGAFLIATNTPDGRVEVFRVLASGALRHVRSIPVGMEPVAVAARDSNEIWVVNHLSDSVSVVDLRKGRVVRTLLVGDEPRDIVFAGADGQRAFVTTAHRGQHRTHASLAGVPGAGDPQLTTPGIGRADVWVFDAAHPGEALGGIPLEILTLFGDTPRALAVTPDGTTVYAAIFYSGNQSTVVHDAVVCDGFDSAAPCPGDGVTMPGGLPNGLMPGGIPGPSTNHAGAPAPEVGLLVHYNNQTGIWEDELERNWNNAVRFTLPDLDVFAIDAVTLDEQATYAHVGTVLFNMAVNPATGRLYVTNSDAQNQVRFEGQGIYGGSSVQGDLARARVTVIDPTTGSVAPRHLNKHIDYSQRPAPPDTRLHSLATPLGMAVSGDGQTLYVAAYGSGKVGVYPTAVLEDDSFDPTLQSAQHIPVSGGGPAGLLLDQESRLLYVYTRFDNGLSVVNTATGREVSHQTFFNPEPAEVRLGRPFLYDAQRTSSNGEASCASCHIFGDMDGLAWELGNPDAEVVTSPIHVSLAEHADLLPSPVNGTGQPSDFHPMKGPMTTQTLRGMIHGGAMHWRGDRSTGFFGTDASDPELSFHNFIVAFPDLLGAELAASDPIVQAMVQRFGAFALQLTLPPNPVRNLNQSLTPSQLTGLRFFAGERRAEGSAVDVGDAPDGFTCEGCHELDPSLGHFGTDTLSSVVQAPQVFKVPHLRNLYQKVGMFSGVGTALPAPQVRGSGFIHDGSADTLFRFFNTVVFADLGNGTGFDGGSPQRRSVEALMLAFDTDLAPVVGQQATLSAGNWEQVGGRIEFLLARAETPFTSRILGGTVTECDLVAQGSVPQRTIGWLYNGTTARFDPDAEGARSITLADFRRMADGLRLDITFTCVPPGSGPRVALDRDADGLLNGDDPVTSLSPESRIMGIQR